MTYGLTALALISFVGSVSVARFRVPDADSPAPHGGCDEDATDIVTAVLVLGGSTLALTAAIGVVRFPDTLTTDARGDQAAGARACCWC